MLPSPHGRVVGWQMCKWGKNEPRGGRKCQGLLGPEGPSSCTEKPVVLCKVDTETELDILSVWQEPTLGKTGKLQTAV